MNYIVCFDSNCYDELIKLDKETLNNVFVKINQVILPQAVKLQLNNISDKDKLEKINNLLNYLNSINKVNEISGIFGFYLGKDIENGELKKDKKIEKKYHSIIGFGTKNTKNESLGMMDTKKSNYIKSLSPSMKNSDKEIALTAKTKNAILITNDKDIIKNLTNIQQKVFSFNDFILQI